MYRALVGTFRWERERRLNCRVALTVRPLSMFMDNTRMSLLLRFGNVWQNKMRACGIECRDAQVVPSNAHTTDYFIRILAIVKFTSTEMSCPTVWFSFFNVLIPSFYPCKFVVIGMWWIYTKRFMK